MLPVKRIDDIIEDIIRAEGAYVDDPADLGGKTKYGITEKVARENGYTGDMKDLPIALARQIYFKRYVIEPGFDKVIGLSPRIAAELVDTGVNMGQSHAVMFLQRALNLFNNQGALWPDLKVDGQFGQRTLDCLREMLRLRKAEGEGVLLFALNAFQLVRYEDISIARPLNEKYSYGWALNRGWLQLLQAATSTA